MVILAALERFVAVVAVPVRFPTKPFDAVIIPEALIFATFTPVKVETPVTNRVVADEIPRVLIPVTLRLRRVASSNTRSF